jgi:hypothetical protein
METNCTDVDHPAQTGYIRRMSTRLAALHPARFLKTAGAISALLLLVYVFLIARTMPLLVIQIAMLVVISGALAWPPKTFRIASTWMLWLGTLCSIVWSLSRLI